MEEKKHRGRQVGNRGRIPISQHKPHTKEIDLKLDRIGNIIREARLNQGLTQEELAELVDVR